MQNKQNNSKKIELVTKKPVFSSFITPSAMINKKLNY
jgi:hypothetical protein